MSAVPRLQVGWGLAVVLLLASAACSSGSPTTAAKPHSSASTKATPVPASGPGKIGDYRLYPISMDYDEQPNPRVSFGTGFRQYLVKVIFENKSANPITLIERGDGLYTKPIAGPNMDPVLLAGLAVVSSDPYTYSQYTVEPDIPGHYAGDGGYLKLIPPGLSDLLPLIFGVAVTAHPPFKFSLKTDQGSTTVPLQPRPAGPSVPSSLVSSTGQPLQIGGVQARLASAGPGSLPSNLEAQSASAPFILVDHPALKTLPWFKASLNFSNPGGQPGFANFSSYLVTGSGYLHSEDLESLSNCCSVAPGQTMNQSSFWALQPSESGPAYVVLIGSNHEGASRTSIWQVR